MARTFKNDEASGNGWGTWDDELNGFIVTCEECGEVCGHGPTLADAAEDAFCNDAHTDGGDEGSGNTYCVKCYERLMDEGYREAMRYEESQKWARLERDRQAREDDFLAAADLAYDLARERGEV